MAIIKLEQPVIVKKTLSPYAFMCLVGDANMVAILTAAKTNPVIELMVEKVKSAEVIDFDDEVRGPKSGLEYCVSQGLLTQDEFDRIMRMEFPGSVVEE